MDSGSLSTDLSTGAVEQSPLFLIALVTQLVVVVCFAAQWLASMKAGRIVLPPAAVYVGVVASIALLVFAALAKDVLLIIAQAMNVLVGLRLVVWMRRIAAQVQQSGTRGLPVVAPDSAEWRPPDPKDRSGAELT